MASVLVPVLYLLVVFGGLFIFGRHYMGRHAVQRAEPYFPRHIERDIYVSLIGMDPPAPDALIKAALLRRAMTDVHRIIRIREDKPAIQQLLQKGLVGEELWSSILAAEKELEAEILEVQAEANTFLDGWGGFIFASASELVGSEKIQAVFRGTPKMRAEFEAKYNRKVRGINPSALPPGMRPGTPAPAAARSPAPTSASSTPAPVTPKTPNSTLAPPSADSVLSSDGENIASPSKSPSKKSKKRK